MSTPIDRGASGELRRLPTLDAESRMDFVDGFRAWAGRVLRPAANQRIEALAQARGLQPGPQLTGDAVRQAVDGDPLAYTSLRVAISSTRHSHRILREAFHDQKERFESEMTVAEDEGPGTLQLDPSLELPEYARHEIHTQLGGYGGDTFAGHVYHYSTNGFYASFMGDNNRDQIHTLLASSVELPEGGTPRRILDQGCGPGQLTVALRRRCPTAEVWGIDASAPMVRYAHSRANALDVPVHFAQRLAEASRFPDDHFDLVTSYLLHHEVPAKITARIAAEAFRILAPGGVFHPLDRGPSRTRSASAVLREAWDHQHNNEVWVEEWFKVDFPAVLRNVGFEVNVGAPRPFDFPCVVATKPR